MSDVLIRDVPDDVLAALDPSAARLGLSRTEYTRRRLAQDARATTINVATDDWPQVLGILRRPRRSRSDGTRLGMTGQGWLIDKSAVVRSALCPEADEWNNNRVERGTPASPT